MLYVNYTWNGRPASDFGTLEIMEAHYRNSKDVNGDWFVNTSTSNLIEAARVLVKRGVIPADQIQFQFNGNIIRHSAQGHLEEWPDGFCDWHQKFLEELIDWNENRLNYSPS